MIRYTRSLKLRVAAAFAAVGVLVSLMLAVAVYFGVRDAGERLIDETLDAEMQDYQARRGRNPLSPPPATATIKGYLSRLLPDLPPPAQLSPLLPGRHEVMLNDGERYRVLVADQHDERIYLLYNEAQFLDKQILLQRTLAVYLALMAASAGLIAWWLAGHIIAPVKLLAERVHAIEPGTRPPRIGKEFPPDEVGELAQSFEQTLSRLADFIERERNFTGDVSHELRTPITIVRGAVEILLADESRPPRDRARLLRIERAATDMADLSSALLTLAREADPSRYLTLDLARVVEEAVDKHRHLLHEGVELKPSLTAHPYLLVDPGLLDSVVSNLLRNAFTYTEHGSVTVELDERELRISDTGPGIARDQIERVFQRLYRGPNSQGAGIGLALVRRICVRQGWHIGLDSDHGHGTRATLQFAGNDDEE